MDPLSITTGCFSLVASITNVSLTVNAFVRACRDSRSDLDSVSRELLSVKTVLELLADDVDDAAEASKNIPLALESQINGIVKNCDGVVKDIEASLQKHEVGGPLKGIKWAVSGSNDMMRLRSSLEAHKAALELALDMVAL
jgi:Fungal N-terminal domain of STAND proteins